MIPANKRQKMDDTTDSPAPPTISIRSYNVLAQGFTAPFCYYNDAKTLEWPARRAAILKVLLSPSPAGGRPTIFALQEVQSSTRGWGRLAAGGGADDVDHAQWFRLALAKHGYAKARRIGVMAMVGGKDKTKIRNATPIEFRDLLISLARTDKHGTIQSSGDGNE